MRESTLGQISAGKFTERPPLSENINSTLLYQKIALKATYTTKTLLRFSTRPGSALSSPVTCLGLRLRPRNPWSRAAVRCTMAARLEGGCGPYRPARVDALPTAPADYPPNLAACALYLPGQRHPGLRCAGLAAVPVPGSAGNAAALRPACFLPLWSPMRLPPRFSVTLQLLRRHTTYPSAKTPCACGFGSFRLRMRYAFSSFLRFCVGAAGNHPAEAWDGEERGGRGQVPPLRVSVGRAGPMGWGCEYPA